MILNSTPILATSAKAFARSLLFSLGVDHTLIEFLANTAIGAATDPYQPAETRFEITRSVLEAVARVPGLRVGITTKSAAISRDVLRAVPGGLRR